MNGQTIFFILLGILIATLIIKEWIESYGRKCAAKGWDNACKDIAGKLSDLQYQYKDDTKVYNILDIIRTRISHDKYIFNHWIKLEVENLGEKKITTLTEEKREKIYGVK